MSKGSRRREGENYADNWDLIFGGNVSQKEEKRYTSEKRVTKTDKYKHRPEYDHDYLEQE
ncbi:hypothetical protein UFOVP35_53 [uncultured Caudovirales phage]|uniref:Uncharacterized protein n=1 Tax=uncultured Caudovirales phage TaxID=2100421 RepID=A0A6J5KUK6_9CAUD|nr:hypothetical protein UFOVP35_53 [uncultured Caudovirales phage]CAB4124982.1 hypothetical protein UFOVP52_70 [uncultured Caudovirales phage]CAB5219811.1 hypothetical protein UFOVP234_18 [uncultured Caudovirales phage]